MTTTIRDRFKNPNDLVESLRDQRLVRGEKALAECIAEEGELVEYGPGQLLIEQGGADRDLYFLLFGSARVIVNKARLYPRRANETVGEMSAIHPHIARAATLEAEGPTVAWKISHNRLVAIGEKFPLIWRALAVELAGRLEQRNQFIQRANARPRVFIICSTEALEIARTIRTGLDHVNAIVEIWSDEKIFCAGNYPLEDLEREVNEADLGIAIAQPDDLIRSRDRQGKVPRDNVIFELGFFMSRLGRARTLLLIPRDEQVQLPSDFKGMNPITYRLALEGENQAAALGPTIDRIIRIIAEQGVRSSLVQAK